MKFISFIYKIPQRFIIFPFIGLLFLALVYGMLWLFIEHRINNFLNGQKNNFKNYNFIFSYENAQSVPWSLWPKYIINSPKLYSVENTKTFPTNAFLWQAKDLAISYTLRHPLSISLTLSDRQLLCLPILQNCLSFNGYPWEILVPFNADMEQSKFSFSSRQIFTSLKEKRRLSNISFLDFTGIVYWNLKANYNQSLAALNLQIPKLAFRMQDQPIRYLNNILVQLALSGSTNTNNLPFAEIDHQLLVQNIYGEWNKLKVSLKGKLYWQAGKTPIGKLDLSFRGIDPFLSPILIHSSLCQSTCSLLSSALNKNELELSLPLSIRKDEIFIGALPFWQLQEILDSYQKLSHQ